jgi:hypothetical protein
MLVMYGPTEATTGLAGAQIVAKSAHAQVFDRHRSSPPSAVKPLACVPGTRPVA